MSKFCVLTDVGLQKIQSAVPDTCLKKGEKKFPDDVNRSALERFVGMESETLRKILYRTSGVNESSLSKLFQGLDIILKEDDWEELERLPKIVDEEAVIIENQAPGSPDPGKTADPNFMGRNNDIKKLEELVRQGNKVILIHGKGGIGKTKLAWQFLNTQGFDKILDLWMAKETQNITSAESIVEEWLRRYFDEEPRQEFCLSLDKLRRYLRNSTQRIGVLIDNLEPALDENCKCIKAHQKYVELFRVLADPAVQSVTLITSRERLRDESVTVENYRLEGLDIAAWSEFLNSRNIQIDTEVLNAMHQAYGGNAQAMKIITSAIKEDNNNLAAYWQANKDDLLIEKELEGLVVSQFNRLQQLDLSAYKLLCRLGCYQYQNIIPKVPIEALLCLLWDVPENQHRRVINSLKDKSLVEFDKGVYWLLPVIRAEAVKRLKESKDWDIANCQASDFWLSYYYKSCDRIGIDVMKSLNKSNNFSSHVYLVEAFSHACSTGDWEKAIQVAINEGLLDTLDSMSLPVKSIEICNVLLSVLPETGLQKSRMQVTQYLGHACLDLGDLEKSENAYHKWLDLCEDTGDLKDKAHALSNIGLIYHNRANYSLSLKYHEDALAIVQQEKEDKWAEAFILGNIGLVYKSLENYQEAINYLAQSVKLNTKISNLQWCSYPLSSLGYVYGCLNDFKKAIKLQKKALSISKQQNDNWGMLLALQNLASTYNRMNDADFAINTINEAKQILNKHGDRRGSTIIKGILGISNKLKEEYELACDNLSSALAGMEEMGLIDGQIDFLLEIGEVYSLLKSYDLALKSINKAKKIAEDAKIKEANLRCNLAKQKIQRF